MEESKSQYKAHVFVCTNEKKCGAKGGEEIRRELKEWAKENPDWKKKIRINNSGCLDRCSEACAVAIYPQNEWLTEVDRKDLSGLKAKITQLMNDGKSSKS